MTLVPAYGRDYRNQKEVLKDWNDEKDFMIADFFSGYDGSYINKPQCKIGEKHMIRYNKLRKIVMVKG